MTTTIATGHAGFAPAAEERLYAKVTWRLIPFLFICYVVAYLDRVNVGFAKLQMLNELQFSEAVYGLGAGIFFLGYFIFEVPSNLMLHRFGARRWIARIMFSWGIISGAMMFVQTPTVFYIMRFFLGVAEAGFFPGIILYLTYWYPSARRSKVTSLFMTGIPMAGVLGGPLSGWILATFDGAHGMAGWKWLFLIEALPSLMLGVMVLKYLDDGINKASWLNDDEKRLLQANIDADDATVSEHSMLGGFRHPMVWVLSAAYFGFIMGLYGIGFWLPTLIKASGVSSPETIGWLVAIPYAAATLAMIWTSTHSDRTGERRWHVALPALVGMVGLIASTLLPQTPLVAVATLTVATMGIITGLAQFWCLPPAFLRGAAAAAGIAVINSVGNLAGFVSPFIVGWIKDVTHSTNNGLYVISASLVVAAAIALSMAKEKVNQPR
ncbi:MFS transporter [Herbaspirillum sp. AP02]|uniref:MFS transporter n=1 Tax=unclassified Herbaspirillum TaxID=2624150 RepID=UPI0015DA12D4|nr:MULTISPECIES: MFS transporter [unclassified Herbaspirillum]MBG7620907.1 MFS transporter [Herbaspirillum sp. AP02]NZD68370.1 MFS transporter [Herbaspirillum sp. AP21]